VLIKEETPSGGEDPEAFQDLDAGEMKKKTLNCVAIEGIRESQLFAQSTEYTRNLWGAPR